MNYRLIFLVFFILPFFKKGCSNNLTDTINIIIDLRHADSLGLKVNVFPPAGLKGNANYQFPLSIPDIYEYLKNVGEFVSLSQNRANIPCNNNAFNINCDLPTNDLNYSVKSSISEGNIVSAENFYFLKDSVYILNWHYLIGFFNANINSPYKITIFKNENLLGAGSLPKKTINDTTDIFQADNYKTLIHHPILYSKADTTSFQIGETIFTVSCAGCNTLYNSGKIKKLLFTPITKICGMSDFKHKTYSFLFYAENSLSAPWLTGLEHPNSTLICFHPAMDEAVIVSASVHEFIHSIYAPIRIRSEVINNFDFLNPECDSFLWFYEGITEYLTAKTLVKSGYFNPDGFFEKLSRMWKAHESINFSKASSDVYSPEGQKLFVNFYTQGSRFAFQLDVEILKRSNNKSGLFGVMNQLQKQYSPLKPFNPEGFIKEFSSFSGGDISDFIHDHVNNKTHTDFLNTAWDIGYTRQVSDSLIWTFDPKKVNIVANYQKDCLECTMIRPMINNERNYNKITVYEVNGELLNQFNCKMLTAPENGEMISISAYTAKDTVQIEAIPKQILKKNRHVNWEKNDNFNSELAKRFWN